MARLSQYPKDTTPNKLDSFLTLDSATGETTRIDIADIATVVADQDLLNNADGALYHYSTPNNLDYSVQQSGILVVNPEGTNANRLFSTMTQIVVSKNSFNGKHISTFLNDLNGYQIKISKLGDLNVFGIFQVTNVQDFTSEYIKLNLVYQNRGSGSLSYGDKFYITHHQTSFDTDFSDNSVIEFGDVYDAGSGYIITTDERNRVNEVTSKIFYSDIIDDVISNRADRPLSANQGLILKQYIDSINTLLTSDNVDLNSLQEVVNFIEANKTTLDSLAINNIAGLQTALDAKVDKVTGKALSENDFTDAYRSKLDGIEHAAEVNVQADYTNNDPANDAYIRNKPTDVTDLTLHSVSELNDISSTGSGAIITDGERQAISGLVSTLDSVVQTSEDLKVNDTLEFLTAQVTEPTANNAIYFTQEDGHDVMQFKNHGHRVSLDEIVDNLNTGILSGGVISSVNTTQFQVAAGKGIIIDFNKESTAIDPHPEVIHVSWAAQTITVFNLDSGSSEQKNSWIYVDSSGTIQQQATNFTSGQYTSQIPLGSVIHSSGAIVLTKTFPKTAYASANQIFEFAQIFGPIKKSGHVITANGANLSIDRSAGVSFAFGRNYATDPNNPSLVTDSARTACLIHRYYSDGAGGFVKDTNSGAGYSVLDFTKYDNGTGTLATVNNNKYTVIRLFYFPNNPSTVIAYYGKREFTTLDDANAKILSEPFQEADNTSGQAIFLGYVIGENTATSLQNTSNTRILQGGLFRTVAYSASGSAAASLIELADIQIQTPTQGQILQYDSVTSQWTNQDLQDESLTGLTDTLIQTPADGQILKYNSSTNQWTNQDLQNADSAAITYAIALG